MKSYRILWVALIFTLVGSCTSDFDEINKNPTAVTAEESSAKFFLTNVQFELYAPNRFPYWRAHIIHVDRFAGHTSFGFNGSWWTDELCYTYNAGYTDAAWGWLQEYISRLTLFLDFTKEGGEFENERMYAVGLIVKGLYFQMFTDTFGEIPYSEAGKVDILLPKYDTQLEIYTGIIQELDEAIAIIGDATTTGDGVQDLGDNDIYFNGDLQKWKKLANTLKLRVAMRAHGAPGADFSNAAIVSALSGPLLEDESDNALMRKDNEISQWGSAAYGDIWHNFDRGSDWTLSQTLISYLRDYDDPRLEKYAKPAPGGRIQLNRPDQGEDPDGFAKFPERSAFILSVLDDADVNYMSEDKGDSIIVIMEEDEYYIGQPIRLNGEMYPLSMFEFWSTPQDIVIEPKNQGDIFPEIVMSTAESYFLQAEAAVQGLGTGNAQELLHSGITHAMKMWDVDDAAIGEYLASSDLAQLTGTQEENIEKISVQRWLAAFTDGFEAWSIVRKSGYPRELAEGVTNLNIFGLGDTNGGYPQRMQYGNQAKNLNGDNVNEAISRQGPDRLDVQLWWAR